VRYCTSRHTHKGSYDVAYNENHTTSTKSQTVDTMTSNEKTVVNPDHIQDHDGTVRGALQLWSCRNGPVQYNPWQSVYFALIRDHKMKDEEALLGETYADRASRVRKMYLEIQESLHGPDHMAEALKAARTGPSEVSIMDRPPTSAGAGQGLDRAASLALPSNQPQLFSMATPRAPDDRGLALGDIAPGADVEFARLGTPDRLLHLPGAAECLEEDAATHTEMTDEQDARIGRYAQNLGLLEGADQIGIEFAARVEQLVPEYKAMYGEWVAANPLDRRDTPIKLFAMEKLGDMSADVFESEYELKRHVYALGQIAGRSPAQSRAYGKVLWQQSSKFSTPQQGQDCAADPTLQGGRSSPSPHIQARLSPEQPPTPSAQEVVRIVESVTKGIQGAMDSVVDRMADMSKERDSSKEDDSRTDKFHAISGMEFKMSPPLIADNDPDLDKHDAAFDNMLACYSAGTKKTRDIDKLHMYSRSFKEGSTRKKVYDNILRRAVKDGRIPDQAKEVMAEIRAELRTYIWETPIQKMVRLDKEFESLEQGGMSHADFRALFESKLQDMEESDMDRMTPDTLYRKYLTKLNAELRTRIMSKEWKVDGHDKPAKAPKTYHEIAKAVGLCLGEVADIHATGHARHDSLMAIDGSLPTPQKFTSGGGGGQRALTCGYCHAQDQHETAVCPQKAADIREHSAACAAKSKSQGTRCSICGSPNHEQRHHMLAIQDYSASIDGRKGGGRNEVVKVGKAGKAATRMVKETSRSRKPRNALPGKSNADTGASATQLEIRVNATTGILWQNGKICYSNTKRTCGPGKIVLRKAKRAMAKARMTKAKRAMAKARMIKAGKGRAKVVPVEQSSPVIQSRPRPSIRLKKHQRNLKPLPRDCLQAQTERGPLTKR